MHIIEKKPITISVLVRLLCELTHSHKTLESVLTRNKVFKKAYFSDRLQYLQELRDIIQRQLSVSGNEATPGDSAQYIWFVLSLCIVMDEDSDIVFENDIYLYDLSVLIRPLRIMIIKLLEEALSRGYDINDVDFLAYFKRLLEAGKSILGYKPLQGRSLNSPHSSLGFYEDVVSLRSFEHFCLMSQAHFNHRIKLAYQIAQTEGITGKPSKRKSPPIRYRLVDSYSMYREVFEYLDRENVEPESLCPQDFLEYLYLDTYEQGFVSATRQRKRFEFDIMLDAVKDHTTLWGWQNRTDKNRSLIDPFKDEDEPHFRERAQILADVSECLESDHSLVKADNDHGEYLTSMKREMVAAKFRSGGQVLLRHHWNDKRAFTHERLCALIGFLMQDQAVQEVFDEMGWSWNTDQIQKISAVCILESCFSGAAIKKVLKMDDPPVSPHSGYIDPIGLYLEIDVLMGVLAIPGKPPDNQKLFEFVRRLFKRFNSKYPDLQITIGSLCYGGRAWQVDRMGLNRLETSHICGSWLPGVRASGQYVKMHRLVELWEKSSIQLAQSLLSLSKRDDLRNSFYVLDQINGAGPKSVPKVSELIASAKGVLSWWETAREKIKLKKQEQFEKSRKVSVFSNGDVSRIIGFTLKKINHSSGDEFYEWISAYLTILFSAYLLLRPGESKNLKLSHLSFVTKSIGISGKCNKAFSEYRDLPLNNAFGELLKIFIDKMSQKGLLRSNQRINPFYELGRGKIEAVFDELNLTQFKLYTFRKWGATKLHNRGIPFDHWQALMGHSQVGFEPFGCYSTMHFSDLRKHVDEHFVPNRKHISWVRERLERDAT